MSHSLPLSHSALFVLLYLISIIPIYIPHSVGGSTIHKKCKDIIISYKYPSFLLSSSRLSSATDGEVDQNHAKTAALNKAITSLQEAYDMDGVVAEFKVKLPFKVEEKFFEKPEIVMYPHEDEEYNNEKQFYYMLHIELLAASKPRETESKIANVRLVKSPATTSSATKNPFANNAEYIEEDPPTIRSS